MIIKFLQIAAVTALFVFGYAMMAYSGEVAVRRAAGPVVIGKPIVQVVVKATKRRTIRHSASDDLRRVDSYIQRKTGLVRGGTRVDPELGATIQYLGTTEEAGKVFAIRVKKLD